MKTVLVCGGRDYGRIVAGKNVLDHPRRRAERTRLKAALGKLLVELGPFRMIHGGARGADELANDWAFEQRGFPRPEAFPALWEKLDAPGAVIREYLGGPKKGRKYNVLAGFDRNQRMIDEGKPDLVIAFPGGDGTADMVNRAEKAGIEVRRIS